MGAPNGIHSAEKCLGLFFQLVIVRASLVRVADACDVAVHVESVVNKKSRLGVLIDKELKHVGGGFAFSNRGRVLVFLWKVFGRKPSFFRSEIMAQAANASIAVAVCSCLALEGAIHCAYPLIINVEAQCMRWVTLEVGVGNGRCSNMTQAIVTPFNVWKGDWD